ncbi:hypothetical protein [Candidatus Colwellia aromaticivorans]|uniref:hypothetical protein n=1 Tax=Candidatus Colwellia aromaticivorans TaxID=2267621 RepID=UPI000DF2A8DF|nr:hypothetical protein [Candidatus Colwellia aromaticivorans]
MKKSILALTINVIAIIVILLWIALQANSASEMTRLRNALLFSVGTMDDFTWTPSQVPNDYRQEHTTVPNGIVQFQLSTEQASSQWKTTLNTVDKLRKNTLFGRAIQSSTEQALALIVNEGRGYCADYTQVINALSYQNKVFAREWGMSFDGYGGWGHAFSEFYIEEWNKWVFVDVYNGFYVRKQGQTEPLSVLEFRQLLENSPNEIVVIRTKGKFGFKHDQALLDYYSRGVDQFYLWWANDSLSYDEHLVIQWVAQFGRPVEQLTAIIIGAHPKIKALPLVTNELMRTKIYRLKIKLISIVVILSLLGLFSGYLLILLIKRRKTLKKRGQV